MRKVLNPLSAPFKQPAKILTFSRLFLFLHYLLLINNRHNLNYHLTFRHCIDEKNCKNICATQKLRIYLQPAGCAINNKA